MIRGGGILCLGVAAACGSVTTGDRVVLTQADREAIEQQRQWLDKPATNCWDGIEGTWVGQDLRPSSWHRYTLEIERLAPFGSQVNGTITGLVWDDDPAHTTPPTCAAGAGRFKAVQPATGRFSDDHLEFIGLDAHIVDICGTGTYFPDRINGYLLEAESEMHTVNNDLVNEAGAVLFIRVDCQKAKGNLGWLREWTARIKEWVEGE